LALLTTGATGLPQGVVDTRVEDAATLPNGPFQLTLSVSYDAYTADPVHRYYQAWQQSDCAAVHITPANPSGCLMDLFPWVEVTVGVGSSGASLPAGFNFNDQTTGEGSISMAFYNVLQGDMPFFKFLADQFTISDNHHQPGLGGTGLNSVLAGFGDAIWHTDGNGNPTPPPATQIENPNPQSGTNNFYTQDGPFGGSYSMCADSGGDSDD
jgi:phospholipase C